MEINLNRYLDPTLKTGAAKKAAKPTSKPDPIPETGDFFTGAEVEKLADRLDGMPDVREDRVLEGRHLVQDPHYPAQEDLEEMSRLLLRDIERTRGS
jgi:hypothetical protein